MFMSLWKVKIQYRDITDPKQSLRCITSHVVVDEKYGDYQIKKALQLAFESSIGKDASWEEYRAVVLSANYVNEVYVEDNK